MRQVTKGKRRVRFGVIGFAGLLTLLLGLQPGAVLAFDEGPFRAARLAYFRGDVSVLNVDYPTGTSAQMNMPLLEGARMETGEDGEAEVEFEDGSLIRLTPRSSVLLSRMRASSDGRYGTEMVLANGLIYAELRATSKYAYRIEAGRDFVRPVANATVRIELDQPPATVAVFDGTARVERVGAQADAGFRVDVGRGESLRGDSEAGGRYFLTQQIEHNSWDDWNEEREQGAANALAARTSARDRYAGDQGYGWSDLDANGTWFDAGQGPVWQPYDARLTGFDPYGYGSWVWYPGPGYVWSSGYAWGWTPFRCGSWNYWPDFGWGWVPSGGYGRGGGGFRGNGGLGVTRRGNTIDLSNVPPGYMRPMPPAAGGLEGPNGPVHIHPIIPVRSGPAPTRERLRVSEAGQIAGHTAMPLRTVEGAYTSRGGSAVGSSLRRDFPVDRITRQPMLGVLTAPAGRKAPGAVSRQAVPVGGAAGGNGATPGGFGTVENSGSVGNSGSLGSAGQRGADGFDRERGQGRIVTVPAGNLPAVGGGTTSAGQGLRPAYPTGNVVAPAGNVVATPGSSVPAPPPQAVRVHPIDREGGQDGPVNRRSQPARMQRSLPMPIPSERSVPSPPPPMRSVPQAPPPTPMRSSPAPSPPAQVRSSPPPPSAPAPAAAPASRPSPASSPKM